MRKIIHNQRDSSPSDDDKRKLREHEESVKDMVSRLESKNAPTKPRIIESKCIEKVLVKDLSPKVTINQQSLERLRTTETVTVNNHISVPNNSGSIHPHDDGDAGRHTKVVRNKNVDLAMASVTRRNENNFKSLKASSGDTENLAPKESSRELPELSINKQQAKWANACKMESVEMVKHQDKINGAHARSERPAKKSVTIVDDKHARMVDEKQHLKMVNWSTVGSSLGKEYITNDRSLIQTKIYDEMEFEEFEVMGEQHYDSLNSK